MSAIRGCWSGSSPWSGDGDCCNCAISTAFRKSWDSSSSHLELPPSHDLPRYFSISSLHPTSIQDHTLVSSFGKMFLSFFGSTYHFFSLSIISGWDILKPDSNVIKPLLISYLGVFFIKWSYSDRMRVVTSWDECLIFLRAKIPLKTQFVCRRLLEDW